MCLCFLFHCEYRRWKLAHLYTVGSASLATFILICSACFALISSEVFLLLGPDSSLMHKDCASWVILVLLFLWSLPPTGIILINIQTYWTPRLHSKRNAVTALHLSTMVLLGFPAITNSFLREVFILAPSTFFTPILSLLTLSSCFPSHPQSHAGQNYQKPPSCKSSRNFSALFLTCWWYWPHRSSRNVFFIWFLRHVFVYIFLLSIGFSFWGSFAGSSSSAQPEDTALLKGPEKAFKTKSNVSPFLETP